MKKTGWGNVVFGLAFSSTEYHDGSLSSIVPAMSMNIS